MPLLLFASGAVPLGLLYWLLIILALIFGVWLGWPSASPAPPWRPIGFNLLLWVLFVIIGLALFGFPIAGR